MSLSSTNRAPSKRAASKIPFDDLPEDQQKAILAKEKQAELKDRADAKALKELSTSVNRTSLAMKSGDAALKRAESALKDSLKVLSRSIAELKKHYTKVKDLDQDDDTAKVIKEMIAATDINKRSAEAALGALSRRRSLSHYQLIVE